MRECLPACLPAGPNDSLLGELVFVMLSSKIFHEASLLQLLKVMGFLITRFKGELMVQFKKEF